MKKYSSIFDDKAQELREKILQMADTEPVTELIYYVSNKGSDNSDGLSPETAWATSQRTEQVKSGSTVLFERGGVFRGSFVLVSGVNYGAYGEGPKPCIYGSLQNYADESLWAKQTDNIWMIEMPDELDVGNIIFDHGKASAMRVFEYAHLVKDYMFLYEKGKVYLYLSTGNPGAIHNDIELSGTKHVIIGAYETTDVTIENLCIKYGAAHGIGFERCSKNITVRGCEIGYIGGGCPFGQTTARYGNGIEFWMECENLVVDHCWVYQCYDAGITHQCASTKELGISVEQKNITFAHNLIEFCEYNIEFFNEDGMTKDVLYTDNILRFAGYGVFDPKDRRGSNSSGDSAICLWWRENPCENFVIKDNILDTAYGYMITGWYLNEEGRGPTVMGNTYLQQPQMPTYFYEMDGYKIVPSITRPVDNTVYPALSQEEMEVGVAIVDKEPKAVIFQK